MLDRRPRHQSSASGSGVQVTALGCLCITCRHLSHGDNRELHQGRSRRSTETRIHRALGRTFRRPLGPITRRFGHRPGRTPRTPCTPGTLCAPCLLYTQRTWWDSACAPAVSRASGRSRANAQVTNLLVIWPPPICRLATHSACSALTISFRKSFARRIPRVAER